MNPLAPHHYFKLGQEAGVPERVLQASAARNAITQAHGAEPILSLGHLAHISGAPYKYLRQIVQRTRDPYNNISRPKKTGGTRFISAPEPILMDVQRLILRKALYNLPLHPYSYAYQEGRTIQACAQQHLGAKWMIKFDLHDFFGQIGEHDVYRVFASRGYSALVSFELARICTRSGVSKYHSYSGDYNAIPTYDVEVKGHLPQGAPTSGALSNAVATPLDYSLHAFATEAGFVYTRYSDDMVLSTCQDFDRAQAVPVIREVSRLVRANQFTLHRKKTRVIPPGARHVVLGLLVDGGEVRLTPEFRRRVEVHIRGVRKFGLVPHSEHRRFRSLLSFVNHVEGLIAFAKSVEPGWAHEQRAEWRAILSSLGFSI